MTTFTFAQLSDPHLTTLEGIDLGDLFNKRILGYLSWRKHRRREHRREVLNALIKDLRQKEPDHIVITGDLTHLGLPLEFRMVQEWLKDLGPASRVTVIPGNHETYVPTPWEETFAHWTPYLLSDEPKRSASQNGSIEAFPSVRLRGKAAFIGLSSAQPTFPFLATGRLDAAQLTKLQEILDQLGEQKLFRVVLVHHPPLAGMVSWRKSLTNVGELEDVLSRCGAELVLHGHAHRSMLSYLSRPTQCIPVVGAPSASAVGKTSDRRACYHLFRMTEEQGAYDLVLNTYTYSPDDQGFHLEQTHHFPTIQCRQS
ncbi:MAG: metallophosphoesterase [Nitrospirales bacterium]|nr:metallophosphoesterase [Nitrospira sp.]MDR4503157.1 metallophosphoesterase [Nitrospirales bacterium]